LNHAVEKYVAFEHVTVLNDDAGDALAPLPAGVEAGQADDGVGVDPAADNARADGVVPVAPSSQHGEAQMIRLHVRSQAQKGEHYQASPGFPG
jgi:hypothetical protein